MLFSAKTKIGRVEKAGETEVVLLLASDPF
jgi:hypothetical protein